LPVILLLALLSLVTSACATATTTIRRGLGSVSSVINVTVSEEQLNQRPTGARIEFGHPADRLLDEVKRVEIHDGFLRFIGTRESWYGPDVEGSFDLSVGARDGELLAEITAVQIPGVSLEDYDVREANRELKEGLTDLASDRDAEVLFQEVVAEEGVLRMKILVDIAI
jgi:hypothetical protein